jgi:hypothetical protein
MRMFVLRVYVYTVIMLADTVVMMNEKCFEHKIQRQLTVLSWVEWEQHFHRAQQHPFQWAYPVSQYVQRIHPDYQI